MTFGSSRFVFSNVVSFTRDLHGPSFTVDAACTSGFTALERAMDDLRKGVITHAVVGAPNMTLNPGISVMFSRLGSLAADGKCKHLDAAGDGYARSEAIMALIIEKKSTARRNYGILKHIKTNHDGLKEEGMAYPSSKSLAKLLEDTYREADVDPSCLVFFEGHGTGTVAGDFVETNVVGDVMTKTRTTPLPVGSVKTNMVSFCYFTRFTQFFK